MPSTPRPSSAALRLPGLRLSGVLLAAALPLLLGGCASQVTLPALPDCHPANAAASTAPLPQPSGLLAPSAPIPAADPDLHEGHEAADHDHARPAGEEHRHDTESVAVPTGHEHPHPSAEPAAEADPEMHGMHGGAGGAGHGDDSAAPDAATVYACPMHPEVRSDSPGTCPKCGMALVPVAPEPGHPEGHEMGPEAGHEGHDHAQHHDGDEGAAAVYACPMHPDVRSDSPGTCPRCGMALEPVPSPEPTPDADEEEHDHDHGSHR